MWRASIFFLIGGSFTFLLWKTSNRADIIVFIFNRIDLVMIREAHCNIRNFMKFDFILSILTHKIWTDNSDLD